MDAGQTQRLENLKARLGKRRQRAAEGEYLRPLLSGLRAARVRCRRLSPPRVQAALGALTSGPAQDERLLWTAIPHGVCRGWRDEAERTARVGEALAVCCDPDAKVAVVWHPASAGLRLRADDLMRHAASILDASPEVWICAADGGDWLIEIARFDREVCWFPGPAPGP